MDASLPPLDSAEHLRGVATNPGLSTAHAPPTEQDDLKRLQLFGYISPVVIYLVPMSLRVLFGACTRAFFVSDFVMTMATIGVVFVVLVQVHRLSTGRRQSVREQFGWSFLGCAGAMIVMNALRHVLIGLFPTLIVRDTNEPTGLAYAILTAISDAIPLLVIWAGLFLFPLALQQAERQRAATVTAEREAEVLRLRANLEPHFVLNTLNTIAGQVGDDPVEARRLIGLLGDLFRDATRDREEDTHGLAAEVQWLERYAAIHEARHRRMVRFEWAIEKAAEAWCVPRLVLQPIVENAILHGALRKRHGGTVRVAARVTEGSLVCVVEDDGPGFDQPARPGSSGMKMVERRISLQGGRIDVERLDGWTRVTLHFERARST